MAAYLPPTSSREGLLRLDFNENTVGCSPQVLRVLRREAGREALTIYPEYVRARARMAEMLGLDAQEVLFTNGTDESINGVVRTFVDPRDEVLIPWPTFPMFRFYVEVQDAIPRLIPYRPSDLSFPLDELCRAVTPRTRAILIANPNNPTGTAIGLAEIERILKRASKAAVLYGLAALRVGCLVSRGENIAAIHKAQSPYSVTSVGVSCALAAFADQEYIRPYVHEVLESREMLYKGLSELEIPYYPSQGNFVLARFGDHTQDVCRLLRQRGILIRDRSRELPGTARITAGKKTQIRRFLRELRGVLAECRRAARSGKKPRVRGAQGAKTPGRRRARGGK
jgi:histidinol-phosphate aminotransferase